MGIYKYIIRRRRQFLALCCIFLVVVLLNKRQSFDLREGLDDLLNSENFISSSSESNTPVNIGIIERNYKEYEIESFMSTPINGRRRRCSSFSYKSDISVTDAKPLPADMAAAVSQIVSSKYSSVMKYPRKKPLTSEYKSVSRHWFRFGGASVWLEEFGVHFMVSRVVFTPPARKNKGKMSFLHAQLFDVGWNELKDVKLSVPTGEDGGRRTMKFPSVLPVEFDFSSEGNYYGPEDPRIILRKHRLGFVEPLVIFNMRNERIDMKRGMHGYFPFRNQLILFEIEHQQPIEKEKNWTPFFSKNDEGSGNKFIHFIYNMEPLDVLKCDLDEGNCHFIYESNAVKSVAKKKINDMRGGTNLVPLPVSPYVSLPNNRQMWVGFARAHLRKCGCGSHMYRPNLMVLIEEYDSYLETFKYKLESISRYLDFFVDLPGWDIEQIGNTDKCVGNSVLIPNGISYWNVLSVETDEFGTVNETTIRSEDSMSRQLQTIPISEIKFNDYLGLTLSAADSDVRMMHMRGLLNYVVNMPSLFDESPSDNEGKNILKNVNCALIGSKDYCESYGMNQISLQEEEEEE